jgi:transposase
VHCSTSSAHRKSVRQRLAKPRIEQLATWFDDQLQKIPGKSVLAGAIRYARSNWGALTRYLDDGTLEISNNAVENQKKLVVQRLRRWGQRAALFYTLIRTAVLNGIEPEAWLRGVIGRIGSHPINRLHELLPWNWAPPATQGVAS